MELIDDNYCFVCGKKNPIGLKLDFSFDGKTIKTDFIPQKEHQGYFNIVHGGIISTLLDEVMVKLAIEMGMPSVTAQDGYTFEKGAERWGKDNSSGRDIKRYEKDPGSVCKGCNGR